MENGSGTRINNNKYLTKKEIKTDVKIKTTIKTGYGP